VKATINGAESHPAQGKLIFADNSVDPPTGTIRLKATFEHTDNLLWPGQFVNVVMTVTTQPNAIMLPSQARKRSARRVPGNRWRGEQGSDLR